MNFSFAITIAALVLTGTVAKASCQSDQARLGQLSRQLQTLNQAHPRFAGDEARLQQQRDELLEQIKAVQAKLRAGNCIPNTPGPAVDLRPDVIMQGLVCLPYGDLTRETLVTKLQGALLAAKAIQPDLLPAPNVKDQYANCRETVGVWRSVAGSETALTGIDILSTNSAYFGIRFPSYSLSRIIREQWDKTPKRYNDHGQPSPNGSLTLETYDVGFDTPAQEISVTVHGSYAVTSSLDLDGELALIDRLSIDGTGSPQCAHSTSFNADASKFWAGTAFLPIPFNAPLIGEIQHALSFAEARVGAIKVASPGCVLAALVPVEIMLEKQSGKPAQKLVFFYEQVNVSQAEGITFSTTSLDKIPKVEERQPKLIQISKGVVRIPKRDVNKPVSASVAVVPVDMRSPVSYTWTVQGGRLQSTADGGRYALFSFPALPANRRSVGNVTAVGTAIACVSVCGGKVWRRPYAFVAGVRCRVLGMVVVGTALRPAGLLLVLCREPSPARPGEVEGLE